MSTRATSLLVMTCAAVLFVLTSAFAQGSQTGTITGLVEDTSGGVLPGVTVNVTSPALQGVRSSVTDANGQFTLPGLPPGTYTVDFELPGMTSVKRTVVVPLGGEARANATMSVGQVTEQVRVVADLPSVIAEPTGSFNIRSEEVNKLAIGRTPARLAEFAPGLTDNTPNVGQVTISGAFAYDNVFLIDGVDVNDNLFGTAHNVFIEDAIDEATVLTSGISAEYGRFSGGVINLVTKRGGNDFSGGVRLNLSKPSWSDETPLEKSRGTERSTTLSKFFEATLGGPIIRDRLWFFGATRRQRSSEQWALAAGIGTPMVNDIENDRYEIKITGAPASGHTLQGSFVENKTNDINRASLNRGLTIDPNVLVTRQTPNRLYVTSYTGALTNRIFVTGQYSEKIFGFRNTGGTSTALTDSPFRTRGINGVTASLHYNAPFFSSLDPEDRNNRQYAGSLSYFLTTPRAGSHTLKVGGENFTSKRKGGNSQSATNFVFQSDYLFNPANGLPIYDAQGRIIPVFVPGVSRVQNWIPTPGATMSVSTLSLYAQDAWALGSRLNLDIGVRYEKGKSEATGDISGADTSSVVPRLGLTYDLSADGRTVLQTTYAHYAGKFSDIQFARNTVVGQPSLVTYQYSGPAGQGFDFAPGLNLANYPTIVSGNFPTANVFFEEGLSPPLTKEFTVSAGHEFSRGSGRVMYTWRHASNFIEDFIDDPSANGKVTVIYQGTNFGTFDKVEFRNSDDIERRYQGVQFMGRYNFRSNTYINGHYTLQLENDGNFEGEATNQPANPSDYGDYPEMLVTRGFPDGRLNDFQRHKIRLWAVHSQSLGAFGNVSIGPLWKYNSALTYSLFSNSVPLSAAQLARNPGYARLPLGGVNQFLFYDERGSEEFKGFGVVDLAINYDIPVWKTVRPWLKLDFFNLFNNDTLIGWTTTVNPVTAANGGPVDADGLPTTYTKASNFGAARANTDYPPPLPGLDGGRTFQLAFGLRF